MAKNKLRRFKENESFAHLVQPTREEVLNGFKLKNHWNQDFFKNDNPIVLELGCGGGEYTIGLSSMFPDKNFIGVDIKGARLWKGAKKVQENQIKNVGYLRTQIELIADAFGENEIDEIWITFPDPQIKFRRAKHRLTHPNFLALYQKILKPNGKIHLKTDSEFLHGYTHGVIEQSGYQVSLSNHDIYHPDTVDLPNYVTGIQTFYEAKFRKENKKITYMCFSLK
ncbi:tRNA (guanosine(46)-N7)-methyltransferase TrmB [Ornithobacterium rhinotracheale]|uniref:tRNA (guanosine(46)-N7)-methyltransferase TrmB n=1 Tax=Ornithobacterium rhinotracheale TaxID=28251 RepID=UPI00129C9829|nr:tRNA (guanosine(46)-N7)-methyltransferase TrmB [Ornithobacterium rhinotracheale]MRI63468.1 tRNA (guanosine(46)-N7)-methyltransferase TrmB [Ornithobacterium rhinotracheale]